MSDESILRDIAGRLPGARDPKKRNIFIGLMAVGVLAFAFLLVTNPLRAWGAWTINTLYFLGIAEGGVVLAAAIRLCNGRWGGPIMRIGESLSSYLLYGIGTMVVLLVAGIWTYLPWTHHVLPRQAWVDGYYDVLAPRAKALLEHPDDAVRTFAAETVKEIEIFECSQNSYGYVFYSFERG